jgi:small neutral amino acid transporter SnatA (MarC family)
MSGIGITILLIFASINPPAVLSTMNGAIEGRLNPRVALVAFLAGAALLLAATFAADAFLDALDLEPETFRISAGIVMAVTGVAFLFFGPFSYPVEPGRKGALFPFAFPLLASPAAFAAVLTRSADKGEPQTVLAVLVVTAAVAAGVFALSGRPVPFAGPLSRLIGAVLIFRAVSLVIDGIRSV